MKSLRQLNEERAFVDDLDGIITVLQQSTISQLRRLESRWRGWPSHMLEELAACVASLPRTASEHPWCREHEGTTLRIVVTTDAGFVGDMNSDLVRHAMSRRADRDVAWLSIGQQGHELLTEHGCNHRAWRGVGDEVSVAMARQMRDVILDMHDTASFARVECFYPRFLHIGQQAVDRHQLLPCGPMMRATHAGTSREDAETEPWLDAAVEAAIRSWLGAQLYWILWSSKLAELAARSMHLEQSTQELDGMRQRASHAYYRALHEHMDRKIQETFASRGLWGGWNV